MEIVREIFVCMFHWPIKMQWNVFCLCCFKFVLEKSWRHDALFITSCSLYKLVFHILKKRNPSPSEWFKILCKIYSNIGAIFIENKMDRWIITLFYLHDIISTEQDIIVDFRHLTAPSNLFHQNHSKKKLSLDFKHRNHLNKFRLKIFRISFDWLYIW